MYQYIYAFLMFWDNELSADHLVEEMSILYLELVAIYEDFG